MTILFRDIRPALVLGGRGDNDVDNRNREDVVDGGGEAVRGQPLAHSGRVDECAIDRLVSLEGLEDVTELWYGSLHRQ